MRLSALLFLLLSAPILANEPYILPIADDTGGLERIHFDLASGATTLSFDNYQLKITAEQRAQDHNLLVIAFPNEQGITFHIQNVRIGPAPSYNLKGGVAHVTGFIRARANEYYPLRRRITVPVEIARVNEFTVSANEALIQGNQFYEKKLPHMVTGDNP